MPKALYGHGSASRGRFTWPRRRGHGTPEFVRWQLLAAGRQRLAGARRSGDEAAGVVLDVAFDVADRSAGRHDSCFGANSAHLDGLEEVDFKLDGREAVALFECGGVGHAH